MSGALQRALSALGVLALGFAAGAGMGHHWATQAADAARGRAVQQALADGQADAKADADSLREQLRLQATHTAKLTERISHARLVAPRPVPAQPARAVPDAAACPGPVPVPGGAAAAAPADPAAQGDADDGDAELTRAAVSLWNSALAGTDVPAGACAPAAAAGAACAAGAGLSLADAWRNHAINAAACAADRERHQRLIDHLHKTRQPHAIP